MSPARNLKALQLILHSMNHYLRTCIYAQAGPFSSASPIPFSCPCAHTAKRQSQRINLSCRGSTLKGGLCHLRGRRLKTCDLLTLLDLKGMLSYAPSSVCKHGDQGCAAEVATAGARRALRGTVLASQALKPGFSTVLERDCQCRDVRFKSSRRSPALVREAIAAAACARKALQKGRLPVFNSRDAPSKS